MTFRFELTRAEMARLVSAPVVGRVGHRRTQEPDRRKAIEFVCRCGYAFVETKRAELEGPLDGWKTAVRSGDVGRRAPVFGTFDKRKGSSV